MMPVAADIAYEALTVPKSSAKSNRLQLIFLREIMGLEDIAK